MWVHEEKQKHSSPICNEFQTQSSKFLAPPWEQLFNTIQVIPHKLIQRQWMNFSETRIHSANTFDRRQNKILHTILEVQSGQISYFVKWEFTFSCSLSKWMSMNELQWNSHMGCGVLLDLSWQARSHGGAQNLCWLSYLGINNKLKNCAE